MSVLPPFELHRPETVEEAAALISYDDLPYVGGTELLLALRSGLLRPRSLVDLKRIDGLDSIEVSEELISIGGTVTHQSVVDHPAVAERVPVMPTTLSRVGNPRVRGSGTLAGNLCFAEPKSDVIPLLIALGADVVLQGPGDSRHVPVEELVLGPYAADKEPDEVLTAIHVPVRPHQAVYKKYQTGERPTLGVAAVRWEGSSPETVVVVGAVGEVPVTERISGGLPDPNALAERIEPVDDLAGSVDYKRHITGVYVKKALDELVGADRG